MPHLDLAIIIQTIGILGVVAIVFAESGLFIGFFLPGDSLLFTAGLLASQGIFNLPLLILGSFVAAVLGDSVGYAFGKRLGPLLFRREDSLLFHKQHLVKTEAFFARHGTKAIVLARFVPIVRTFTPILAGVGKMRYKTFLSYNIIGALGWAVGVPLAGYWLGATIPGIDHYLLPIVLGIIIVSFIPPLVEWYREQRTSRVHKKTLG
ncbi:MAG: VTT domain-containing protein [Patescibacteria group bacterium]|jgi:membrane-associated protein